MMQRFWKAILRPDRLLAIFLWGGFAVVATYLVIDRLLGIEPPKELHDPAD